jgi:hypothetical protein
LDHLLTPPPPISLTLSLFMHTLNTSVQSASQGHLPSVSFSVTGLSWVRMVQREEDVSYSWTRSQASLLVPTRLVEEKGEMPHHRRTKKLPIVVEGELSSRQ